MVSAETAAEAGAETAAAAAVAAAMVASDAAVVAVVQTAALSLSAIEVWGVRMRGVGQKALDLHASQHCNQRACQGSAWVARNRGPKAWRHWLADWEAAAGAAEAWPQLSEAPWCYWLLPPPADARTRAAVLAWKAWENCQRWVFVATAAGVGALTVRRQGWMHWRQIRRLVCSMNIVCLFAARHSRSGKNSCLLLQGRCH